MSKTFQNVEPEKKKLILNAALQEFTEKGFDQASTNKIVKEAGIGKGMLFYYFTNKKGLYEYLIEYCIDVIEHEYLSSFDYSVQDLFERMRNLIGIKWDSMTKHPNVINFTSGLLLKDSDDIDAVLKSRFEALREKWYSILYKNIDFSLFREDVDAEKAFELVQWSIQGYEDSLRKRLYGQNLASLDYDCYYKEFFGYLDVLKIAFYKSGENAK